MTDFLNSIVHGHVVDKNVLMQYSPLVLAYMGDAVYEVFIRTQLVAGSGSISVNTLHHKSIGFVKARAQSETLRKIANLLTPEEKDIVRRGRNAKSNTIPQNAEIEEYRHATGFETLIGYLYLSGETGRLMEVLQASINTGQEANHAKE